MTTEQETYLGVPVDRLRELVRAPRDVDGWPCKTRFRDDQIQLTMEESTAVMNYDEACQDIVDAYNALPVPLGLSLVAFCDDGVMVEGVTWMFEDAARLARTVSEVFGVDGEATDGYQVLDSAGTDEAIAEVRREYELDLESPGLLELPD